MGKSRYLPSQEIAGRQLFRQRSTPRILGLPAGDHGDNSSAVRRTVARFAPPEASVAAITAPSTIGALQTTTRPRFSSASISIAISLLVSAPPRSTRIATPASDHAR